MASRVDWLQRASSADGGAVGEGDGRQREPGETTDTNEAQALEALREIEAVETAADERYGLHEITKKLDKWFGIEVWRLEQAARRQAGEWARAGLPRPGVDDERLPVEAALAARAAEIYRKWLRLVRTRVQDGIASATRRAGRAVIQLREQLAALRRALREIEASSAEVVRFEAETEGKTATLGFTRLLGPWKFRGLIALLILVDWVANVPIFHELLPRDPGADEMWANVVARSEKYQAFAGVYRSFMRVVFVPEVSLLALGVIAFLVFLAHVFGESVRNIVAVAEEDLPDARAGIRAHRRQFKFPAAVSLIGALSVVGVLFLAREKLKVEADARYEEAAGQVRQLETRLAAARERDDLDTVGEVNRQLSGARAVAEDRDARAQYAAGIQSMNFPITILNLVLLIAAASASYLAANTSLTERRLVHPKLAPLHEHLGTLRSKVAEHRAAIRQAAEEVQAELNQADRLLHSRPLAEWQEKVDRLGGVIALFRAENARERGMDPATILAFQRPIALDLPDVDADEPLEAPAELLEVADDFRQLRLELAQPGRPELAYAQGEGP